MKVSTKVAVTSLIMFMTPLPYILSSTTTIDRGLANMAFIFVELFIAVSFIVYSASIRLRPTLTLLSIFLFIILIMASAANGAAQNGFYVVLPTLMRFCFVFFMGWIGYMASARAIDLSKLISPGLFFLTLLVFGSVVYQLFSGTLAYANGAYRLSGYYGEYVTGLSLLTSLMCLIFFFLRNTLPFGRLIALILFLIVLGTQSRLATVAVPLSAGVALITSRSDLKSMLPLLILFVAFFAGLTYVALSTSLLPRITDVYINGLNDGSTNTRLLIWAASIAGLDPSEWWVGVGLGGFNFHYFNESAILGVAAHNDYVQLLIEGGLILLASYIFMNILILKTLLKFNRDGSKTNQLAVAVFLNCFIFSSLHNPYYYFESMAIAAMVVGYGLAKTKLVRSSVRPCQMLVHHRRVT